MRAIRGATVCAKNRPPAASGYGAATSQSFAFPPKYPKIGTTDFPQKICGGSPRPPLGSLQISSKSNGAFSRYRVFQFEPIGRPAKRCLAIYTLILYRAPMFTGNIHESGVTTPALRLGWTLLHTWRGRSRVGGDSVSAPNLAAAAVRETWRSVNVVLERYYDARRRISRFP